MLALVATVAAAGCGGDAPPPAPAGCIVRVFFAPAAPRAAARALERRLVRDPHVERVTFVSKEQALRSMKRKYPELFDPPPPRNPLPDALRIRPKAATDVAAVLDGLRPRPRGVAKVNATRRCGSARSG